jgi:hypothetical protein
MRRENKNGSVEGDDAPQAVAPKAAPRFDTGAAKAWAQQTLAHPLGKVVCLIHQ